MGCEVCVEAQADGNVYYYRWKDANVAISCCAAHFMQVRDALNAAQGVD